MDLLLKVLFWILYHILGTAVLFVWQLPQNILGLGLYTLMLVTGRVKTSRIMCGTIQVWIKPIFFGGVSLGAFCFVDTRYGDFTMGHEYGHSMQSRRWGPLYLIVVGLPSLTFNILTRLGILRRETYYYRWPENEACKLGHVGVKNGQLVSLAEVSKNN